MRSAIRRRTSGLLALVGALSACNGSGSVTAPELPVVVATGPQVLRITYQGACNTTDGRPFIPLLYVRVVVTRIGNEWAAAAATPAAGDVELRFHLSGLGAAIPGSAPVEGAIRGVAIHNPELLPSLPPSTARANFGAGAFLNGFAFSPSAITPATGVSGVGNGTVTISDNEGHSCSGSSFSWGLGPQS